MGDEKNNNKNSKKKNKMRLSGLRDTKRKRGLFKYIDNMEYVLKFVALLMMLMECRQGIKSS